MQGFTRQVTVALLVIMTLTIILKPHSVHSANTYSELKVPTDYPTIQQAINAASPGDIIHVLSGTYNESFTVNKDRLQIVGDDKFFTILHLGESALRIVSQNTTLRGFTIKNSTYPFAVCVESSWNNISDNIFESNVGSIQIGLEFALEIVKGNAIIGNQFRNCLQINPTLQLYNSSQNLISSNNFSNCNWGIALWENSSDNTIESNLMVDTQSTCMNIQNSPRCTITNNYLNSGNTGIYIDVNSDNSIVSRNTLVNLQGALWGKIYLLGCKNVTVIDNQLVDNSAGVYINNAYNAIISNNTMLNNKYGLGIHGSNLSHFVHTIDDLNTINGKPIYYIVNEDNLTINSSIYPEIGLLAIVNSTNMRIQNLQVSDNWQGIILAYTTDSRVENVTVSRNFSGIDLYESSNNTITKNTLLNNTYGLRLQTNSANTIFKNNFINNTYKPQCPSQSSAWDNSAEGNYWSGYTSADLNLDGIGDSAYTIADQNVDNFPLIDPFAESKTFYCGTWEQVAYYVTVQSNSTVASFTFEQESKMISFNTTGPNETQGFCQVCIPKQLLNGVYTVKIGNYSIAFSENSNGTHNFLSFSYNHSTQNIKIVGTTAIPEFQILTPQMLTVILAFSLFFLAITRRRRKLSNSAFSRCSSFTS